MRWADAWRLSTRQGERAQDLVEFTLTTREDPPTQKHVMFPHGKWSREVPLPNGWAPAGCVGFLAEWPGGTRPCSQHLCRNNRCKVVRGEACAKHFFAGPTALSASVAPKGKKKAHVADLCDEERAARFCSRARVTPSCAGVRCVCVECSQHVQHSAGVLGSPQGGMGH